MRHLIKQDKCALTVGMLFSAIVALPISHAGESVFGGTNFTSQTGTPESRATYEPSVTLSKREWSAKMALGMGISQLISEERPDRTSTVTDSAFQMNLAGMIEREIAHSLSLESGLALGMQFVKSGPKGETIFSPRYLDVPLVARLYFSRQVSVGVGGFATVPIDSLEGAPLSRRLTTTDLGFVASARWNVPVNRQTDWVVEINAERGMMHVGDAGAEPNHLRNVAALIGMSARF